MTASAEQRVFDRLRSAMPPEYRLYPNVRWISKRDANAPARDGETDLLIVHPENGLLIVETKGGRIRRDGLGRWWSGEHELKPPPFEQAENSKHALTAKLTSLPDWPGRPTDLRAGHAVAFPDVGVRTSTTRAVGLGPDTDFALVVDQGDLASDETARMAVARAYDFWLGDRRRGSALSARQLELIDELLAPIVELAPMLRPEVERGEREVVRLSRPKWAYSTCCAVSVGRPSSVRPGVARRCLRARRRAGWPGKGSAPCSSASTSRWRAHPSAGRTLRQGAGVGQRAAQGRS